MIWIVSSIGESIRLITERFRVRVPDDPLLGKMSGGSFGRLPASMLIWGEFSAFILGDML